MIDKDKILQLAKYSRLEFSDEEFPKLLEDLENIMEFTSKVSKYDDNGQCDDCSMGSSHEQLNPSYPRCSRSELLYNGSIKNDCFYIKQ